MKKNRIARRRFLRCDAGGMGTAVALPALESMFQSDNAFAQVANTPRYWFIIFDEYDPQVDRVGEHWEETMKLVALAFQCEVTRTVTYMLGGETVDARLHRYRPQ